MDADSPIAELQTGRAASYNCQMPYPRPFLAAFLASICGISLACGNSSSGTLNGPAGAANRAAQNSDGPRTNVEELGLLVNIPYEVMDVVWKEDQKKKTLMAVLRFSPADAAKIVAEAEKVGAFRAATIQPEPWFPDELTAQSEMSGDALLKGKSYPANGFLQEGYSAGTITRIDGTDYFILQASAN